MNPEPTSRPTRRALASTLALFGALGIAGYAGDAQAGIGIPECGPSSGSEFERTSQVTDLVIDHGDGTWTYEFRVCNTSDPTYGAGFLLRDWELPWDHTASNPIDELTIMVPEGWAWSIETRDVPNFGTGWDGEITWQDVGPDGTPETDDDDPFFDTRYATHPEVLHFYTNCGEGGPIDVNLQSTSVQAVAPDCRFLDEAWLRPGEDLTGFSFVANVAPTNAPYQASWIFQPPRSGDPAYPLAGSALSEDFFDPAVTPEPSSLLLLGASLGGVVGAAALRRRREDGEDTDGSGSA